MRAAVICDDRYHPGEIIIEGMTAVGAPGIELEFVTDTTDWAPERVDDFGVVVISKGNARTATDYAPWLSEPVQQRFVDFVERGGGLLMVHSGTVGYKDAPLFRNLVGGGFRHHPAPGPVEVAFLDNCPIPDLHRQPFRVHDEHYLMEIYHDDLEVFMTSTSEAGTEPAGWTRIQGAGRVCALTPGHYREVWQNPDYLLTLRGALEWCAGRRG